LKIRTSNETADNDIEYWHGIIARARKLTFADKYCIGYNLRRMQML